jgi:hypothetical protein
MKTTLVMLLLTLGTLCAGQTAKPRQATLAQQKMCAEQAQKIFKEDNPTRPEHAITWEYTSHYEPRTNVCYIMTHTATVKDKGFSISYAVYDAIEGRGYASFIQIDKDVMECDITRPGQDEEQCHSSDEFRTLVEKYFGVGQ